MKNLNLFYLILIQFPFNNIINKKLLMRYSFYWNFSMKSCKYFVWQIVVVYHYYMGWNILNLMHKYTYTHFFPVNVVLIHSIEDASYTWNELIILILHCCSMRKIPFKWSICLKKSFKNFSASEKTKHNLAHFSEMHKIVIIYFLFIYSSKLLDFWENPWKLIK